MEKYLVLLFILSCTQLRSQQFFDSSIHYLTVGDGVPGFSYCYYHMVLDSVSNDTQYYTKRDIQCSGFNTGNYYQGFKVISNRVFISVNEFGKSDFLLYDFNLEEGDSTHVYRSGLRSGGNVVLKVDSIRPMQLGSLIYKTHYVKVDGLPFTFVDHIGSLENGIEYFLRSQDEAISAMDNLCKNDTLLYWIEDGVIWIENDRVESGANTCHPVFYSSGISDRLMPSKPFVFPNPSGGMVHIDAELAHGNLVLEIYGMNGQLLQSFSVENGETIDLKMLPSGLYYLRLLSSGGNRRQILSIN